MQSVHARASCRGFEEIGSRNTTTGNELVGALDSFDLGWGVSRYDQRESHGTIFHSRKLCDRGEFVNSSGVALSVGLLVIIPGG